MGTIYTVDGIRYETNGTNTVKVIAPASGSTYSGAITIPSTITPETAGATYTVTEIGDDAFWNNEDVTSISLPNTVTVIGVSAFGHMDATTSNLTSVNLGNSITSIGGYAFCNCRSLTSITLPSTLISIGSDDEYSGCSVFTGCKSLTSLVIPDNVTVLYTTFADDCTALASLTLPANLTAIWDNAFQGDEALTSVTIPANVTSIKTMAFEGCTSLSTVTFKSTTPPTLGSDVFLNDPLTAIYVPSASLSAYKTAYSDYESIIVAEPETYNKLTYGGKKIQVDSAVRDGDGRNISTKYTRTITANGTTYSASNGNIALPFKVYSGTDGVTVSDSAVIKHTNSITSGTIGSSSSIPTIKYDAQGHITETSGSTVYVPTSAGTAGQIWTSNGSGGEWKSYSGIMTYKGSKADVATLIADVKTASVGDVYNIVAAVGTTPAGTNWACYTAYDTTVTITTDTFRNYYDALGGSIDLTRFDNHLSNTSNPHSVTASQIGITSTQVDIGES